MNNKINSILEGLNSMRDINESFVDKNGKEVKVGDLIADISNNGKNKGFAPNEKIDITSLKTDDGQVQYIRLSTGSNELMSPEKFKKYLKNAYIVDKNKK